MYQLGQFYCDLLQECNEEVRLQEAHLQRAWFEEALERKLRTNEGGTIEIVQPGFWNRAGGPDFLQACILNEQGEQEVGAVEVHVNAGDWEAHGHEEDPQYRGVILHLYWNGSGKGRFTRKEGNRHVREVEMQGQMRVSLEEIQKAFPADPQTQEAESKPGSCETQFQQLNDGDVMDILREAGWYRLKLKERMIRARVEAMGKEQALWVGLAEALGYAENKIPFRVLAQRLRVESVEKMEPLRREAFLYGLAGLLPETVVDSGRAGKYERQLWDVWWKDRSEWAAQALHRIDWKFAGLRPQNRPERRLAAMALLGEGKLWRKFVQLVDRGNPDELISLLNGLEHPFWLRRWTFRSRTDSTPMALMGESRIQSFLFNVVWPLRGPEDAAMREWFDRHGKPFENRAARIAHIRLLDGRRVRGLRHDFLCQEGLVQIYRDYCLKDCSACMMCGFTDWVRNRTLVSPRSR